MKVWLDQDLCGGCGCCEMIAPDVFRLDDNGLSTVIGEVVSSPEDQYVIVRVQPRHQKATQNAVEECPGGVIFAEFD